VELAQKLISASIQREESKHRVAENPDCRDYPRLLKFQTGQPPRAHLSSTSCSATGCFGRPHLLSVSSNVPAALPTPPNPSYLTLSSETREARSLSTPTSATLAPDTSSSSETSRETPMYVSLSRFYNSKKPSGPIDHLTRSCPCFFLYMNPGRVLEHGLVILTLTPFLHAI
jgi:hypothetical protein